MNARIFFPGLFLLVSACQSAIPFYEKGFEEPEWFKAKGEEADAKGYPPARAVPPKPQGLTTPAGRDAELRSLENAGAQVREHPRAGLNIEDQTDLEAFSKKAQEETKAPPLIDENIRPE